MVCSGVIRGADGVEVKWKVKKGFVRPRWKRGIACDVAHCHIILI